MSVSVFDFILCSASVFNIRSPTPALALGKSANKEDRLSYCGSTILSSGSSSTSQSIQHETEFNCAKFPRGNTTLIVITWIILLCTATYRSIFYRSLFYYIYTCMYDHQMPINLSLLCYSYVFRILSLANAATCLSC